MHHTSIPRHQRIYARLSFKYGPRNDLGGTSGISSCGRKTEPAGCEAVSMAGLSLTPALRLTAKSGNSLFAQPRTSTKVSKRIVHEVHQKHEVFFKDLFVR